MTSPAAQELARFVPPSTVYFSIILYLFICFIPEKKKPSVLLGILYKIYKIVYMDYVLRGLFKLPMGLLLLETYCSIILLIKTNHFYLSEIGIG